MAQALPMVKKTVTSLVDSGTKIPRWVLTNFKDPAAEMVTSTTDVEHLRSSLDELKYGGGGDIWEQVLKGKESVQKPQSWGKIPLGGRVPPFSVTFFPLTFWPAVVR